jgi:hypothetical protein
VIAEEPWKRGVPLRKEVFPHPAVLNQQYCGSADCQKARKRKWQKEKLARDPDYRENQAAAQKASHLYRRAYQPRR